VSAAELALSINKTTLLVRRNYAIDMNIS